MNTQNGYSHRMSGNKKSLHTGRCRTHRGWHGSDGFVATRNYLSSGQKSVLSSAHIFAACAGTCSVSILHQLRILFHLKHCFKLFSLVEGTICTQSRSFFCHRERKCSHTHLRRASQTRARNTIFAFAFTLHRKLSSPQLQVVSPNQMAHRGQLPKQNTDWAPRELPACDFRTSKNTPTQLALVCSSGRRVAHLATMGDVTAGT